jgi:hypothetical protein
MKEVALREFMRGLAGYLVPGEYVLTKRDKPYLKVVITPAEEEKPTVNMITNPGECMVPWCKDPVSADGYCVAHQRSGNFYKNLAEDGQPKCEVEGCIYNCDTEGAGKGLCYKHQKERGIL